MLVLTDLHEHFPLIMGFYQFERKQFLHSSLEEVWDFISSPANLKEITPGYMGFDILSENLPDKVYPGMIICYRVKPILSIPVTWVTEITQVVEKEYFIDQQLSGPYALWHHQHLIEKNADGILMTDIVSYKPPLGFLGSIANKLFIRQKLEEIFNYRHEALTKRFPG